MTEYLTEAEVRRGLSAANIGDGPEPVPAEPEAYHLPVVPAVQALALPWTWVCSRCERPARNHAPDAVIRRHMNVASVIGAQLAPTLRRS